MQGFWSGAFAGRAEPDFCELEADDRLDRWRYSCFFYWDSCLEVL